MELKELTYMSCTLIYFIVKFIKCDYLVDSVGNESTAVPQSKWKEETFDTAVSNVCVKAQNINSRN